MVKTELKKQPVLKACYKTKEWSENSGKAELKKQKVLKACYGTKEWSENSGICCNCRLRNDCGKIAKK